VTTLYATQPREAPSAAAFATAPSGTYAVIVAVFCGLLLISNIAATKTITVVDGLPAFVGGGIFTDGGAFLFPLTYIVGDVLAEVYGLRQAKRAIWVGFALGALASLTFLAVGAAPPGPGYENQEAFVAVLGFVPRIVLASLSGYLAGQFLNAYVVVKIKERTKERHLWARLIGSTVVGEFADTALFCFIAFVGVFPTWGGLISYAVAGYVYKVMVEVIMLPVTYAVIKAIKKREPGYTAATSDRGAPVRQMRLVVAVEDYHSAVRFYRDELGLVAEETYDGENGAQVMILGAGRATLELSNRPQIDLIDTVEVGRTGVSGKYRIAFEVDDSAGVAKRLTDAGAEVIAPPTVTPWRSLNARLQGPADLQLTIFPNSRHVIDQVIIATRTLLTASPWRPRGRSSAQGHECERKGGPRPSIRGLVRRYAALGSHTRSMADSGAVRQDLRSKINRATTSRAHEINQIQVVRSTSGPAGHRTWKLTLPSVACAISVSNTLPPVRLNSHAYQKVTATVVAISGRLRSNCGMKTSGRCQPAISSPSTAVDARGDHFDCSRG